VIPPENVNKKAVFTWGVDEKEIVEPEADPQAPEGAREWAANFPMFNVWGGYGVHLKPRYKSEWIRGFGLYGDNLELWQKGHHPTLIYFRWREPEPDGCNLLARLIHRVE
jgi:hypothetical protein